VASLKTNVLLNYLNTFTRIAFPLITYPYATRILLVEDIGLVNFYASLVNYLIVFSNIGTHMYATKEVARYQNDVRMRDKCAAEILLLALFFCMLGYVAVTLLAIFEPRIHAHYGMFLILSLSILFTTIGVEWFYRAIEDFAFITVRGIAFRVLAAIGLFLFVRTADDVLAYCLVTVSLSVGNNFINIVHVRKLISFRLIPWRKLNPWRHLLPSLRIFVPSLVTDMYGQLNIVVLGFLQTAAVVGIYSMGSKLVFVALMVITSTSMVLLPRSASLIASQRYEEFRNISLKAVRLTLVMALPCMVGMMLLSSPIIVLFCGSAYAEGAIVVALLAPILLFIGLSNIIGIQILYSQGKDKIVLCALFSGVVANFLLDLLLIPDYHYVGAAVAQLLAEVFVILLLLALGKQFIPFSFFELKVGKPVLAVCAMGCALALMQHFLPQAILSTLLMVLAGGAVYALALYFLQDELFCELLCSLKASVSHKR